ncbi:tumor necrosis factor receptor superfamily member 6 isoform X1 [Panthera onca]|uniref:tumor necrosis factor receptor superfamily member 6 isoform X1 n=1 Tax=Panthera onca TaxID=9690 RepID=UPI002955B5B5|nr:tumor necrosis factor receptor superfamily member 6 isoform X1 [Panthera onca]
MKGPWAVRWLILTSVAGSLFRGDSAQVADVNSKVLKLSKNATEGEPGCKEGLHRGSKFCCLPCSPGTRKAADCEEDGGTASCIPCEEGKDYTDTSHFSPRCRRCRICDGEHGLEVEKACTRTQDTKCRCKSNFFCNVSLCEHCNPCMMCEHGILENCTPTSNTKCKQGSSSKLLWLCALLLILPSALVCCCVLKQYRNTKNGRRRSTVSSTVGVETCIGFLKETEKESIPMNFADIDLSKYISSIAEQMKITQVREFVRKNGINEAKIDEIKNDNLQDTAEQKVQLLRNWYQLHGRKGAYYTLMKGLRKANLYALAEKIEDLIQKDSAG